MRSFCVRKCDSVPAFYVIMQLRMQSMYGDIVSTSRISQCCARALFV